MLWTTRAPVSLLLGLLLAGVIGCGASETPSTATAPASVETPAEAPTAAIAGPTTRSAPDRLHPMVLIETSAGNITVRLDAQKSPLTVGNFLGYVDRGFYNRTLVHQVFRGQGVMGGGYTTEMTLKEPGYPIYNEAHNGLKNRRGTIAMVRTADAINSAQSQFLFNVADNEALDHKDRSLDGYGYCVFGEVVSGLEVLDRVATAPVRDTPQLDNTPVEPIVVRVVRRL